MWKNESATRSSARTLAGIVALAVSLAPGSPALKRCRPAKAERTPLTPRPSHGAGAEAPRALIGWIDSTATFLGRYPDVETSAGVVSARAAPGHGAVKARVKIDPRGRFTVDAGRNRQRLHERLEQHRNGTGNAVKTWSMKQLYMAAPPPRVSS